jgi:hypothetical protein
MMKTAEDILIKAGKKFELITGIKFSIKKRCIDLKDAVIELQWNGEKRHFATEVKTTLNAAIAGQFKQHIDHFKNTPLLITSYVAPALSDHLRISNVNFIDAAGNAFINEPPLFIHIKGNKPDEPPSMAKRLYRASGLKIIFALLCNPGLENKDYRAIAAFADVALGSVGWVMGDLQKSGYLISLGKKGRSLTKKDELLKNWVSNYHEELKPKIFIGKYAAINEDWWKKVVLRENTLWGAEVAANILTKYLKPEIFTLYSNEADQEFLIKNRLHRTDEGSIEIYKKFWSFQGEWTNQNIVPPLLIYADLIASQSDRNIETAKMIYEKEIDRFISQD